MTKETILQTIVNNPQLANVLTTENRERFAELVAEGSELDLQFAIRLIVDGYIDNCGISSAVRTIYYDAGTALFEAFIKTDAPLAKELRAKDIDWFGNCMESFNELYSKEEYGDYDITLLEPSDYLELCMKESSYNLPLAMKRALCCGIYLLLFEEI